MSPTAAEAEAGAERMTFRKGPWWTGFGHLLHMPSHTFLRIGRYHDAVLSNINANRADLAAEARCKTPYGPDHNMNMLINSAAMCGEVCRSIFSRTWMFFLEKTPALSHPLVNRAMP